jgi:hypothetical protein
MLNCKSDEAPFQRISQVENDCKPVHTKQQHYKQLIHQTDHGILQSKKQNVNEPNVNEPITFWNVKKDTRK